MYNKSKRSIEQFTYDIEEFITEIKDEIKNKTYSEFSNDKKSIAYIERQIEKIAEAIAYIQKLDKDLLYRVNENRTYWENIKGMRNHIVHEYWGTSVEMLYEISFFELDELLTFVLKIREKIKIKKL